MAGPFGALPPHAVHVWLVDPRELSNPAVRRACLAILTPDERLHGERFMFPADRDAFVAARALARAVLAQHAGGAPQAIEFATGAFGKPRLHSPAPARALSFNVSHTRELVACAVAWDRDVGVDVESVRDPPLALADAYFAPPEAAALRALAARDQPDAFFAIWTMKEAFIKATGRGLSQPLDRFAVTWAPPALLPYGDFEATAPDWHFVRDAPTASCALAVCAARRGAPPPDVAVRWAPGAAIAAGPPD